MARSRDLFDDTTMTFGEHLEVLRIHVFKAILGLVVTITLSLFFGDRIFSVLRSPVESALRARGITDIQMDAPNESFLTYLKNLWSPPPEQPASEPVAELRADQVRTSATLRDVAAALRKVGFQIVGDAAASKPPTAGVVGNPSPAASADSPQPPATASGPSGETIATDEPSVELVISAPEFAQLRRVVEDKNKVTTFQVEEGFLAYMKVSFVAGFVFASPWVFYQIWQFVAAGLHAHERKYVYVFLPMSLGLFIAGAFAGYFYAFPLMLNFLFTFNDWLNLDVQVRLSNYISMVLLMPLMFGISFQLPLVMLFLERLGIFTQQAYKSNWRIAVLVIAVVSMLLTPQDPGSMLLMMLPLVFLYVVGIYLCNFRINTNRSPIS